MTTAWSRVKVDGPLAPYSERFGRELVDRGYTDLSTAEHLRLMGHLSRWMADKGLDAAGVSAEHVEEYCRVRRAQGYTARLTPSSLGRLREFLRDQGALASPSGPELPASSDQRLLARYEHYLVAERGLVERVVSMWLKVAVLFLIEHPGLAAGATRIGVAEVSAYCTRELPRRSRSAARNLAAALRSFLRFLHVEGVVEAPLAQAVPAVANRSGAGLPRGLDRATVARLLATCDRRTGRGRRDYAVLVLLARLGLRAGEVARLSLDDIDWRAGEVVVHGKGARVDRLPLPSEVGDAVVGYLRRGRPRVDSRVVFLRAIAPTVALSPVGITWVVYSACDRAGVAKVGAHRLRHTLATDLLRAGGSLVEVGQVLRHATLATTTIYAKVDVAALAPLAPPWPGGAA
ncbi:MAG: tyrosine-type recombinase/integrase [Acidimicrobiales bacterium]